MPDQSLVSILHLSDFHFTKRRVRDQQIVVDALVEDLKTLCIGHRRPDVIMFTGDLVNAGGVDGHLEAYDALLARVSKATGCSDERIFIVPGNHDLSRSVVEASRDDHVAWRNQSADMAALNALYDGGTFGEVAELKFSAYLELERLLSDTSVKFRNPFVSVHYIEALNIDIVVINTAMLSSGGLQDLGKDEGHLAVPEYALHEALKFLSKDSYRIFGSHHPFSMLSDAGARYLRGAIEQHAHLHMFGHMHDPLTASTSSINGELFSNQAGAIFTHRSKQYYIGYSLISVDRSTSHYETHLRSYFDDRKVFDEARDIVSEGRFYSSQRSREFWRTIATPVDDIAFRKYLSGAALEALKCDQDLAPGDRDPHKMFVAPPLKRTTVTAANGEEEKSVVETPVDFNDLIADDGNSIIYAAPEFGRTTVLKEIQYRLTENAETVRFPRLPILIDFSDIRHNCGNLLRLVKSRPTDLISGMDVESLLKLGHVCLLFDDVLFSDKGKMTILREFVSNFPKVRYIFSSSKTSAAPYGAHVVPEMPIHFEFIELCVLRRRDMRLLITNFGGSTDVDVVLDQLQSEFKEINLPFTAANGSILMTIYEERSGFRPINRSVLIEQFIDTMLRKTAVEQIQRETFDYANKTALLAHIAAWMAKENNYTPASEAVRGVIKSYLDRVGLIAPVGDLMNEFIVARIFVNRSEDRLAFRYRALLEYFIALQMRDDPDFKAWVMDESRYLQFVNEIQYYAGKLRNDAVLVDEVGRRFGTLLLTHQKDIRTDLGQLASLELPKKNSDLTVDHLAQQLSAPPLSQEERDEELQFELPRDVEERQEVFRPKIEDPGQRLLVALILYSGILKNMELIEDAQKRRHLSEIWRGWSTFLHMSLTIVTDLARHRRIRINGVLYELGAPAGMSDVDLARAISLNMPIGVSRMIAATLGTEKLERQLVEPQLDTTGEPLVYELLRAALIADLRLDATPSALRAALERLRPSNYLLQALIWKIAELRRFDRLKQSHFEKVAEPMAAAIAHLRGGTRKEQLSEKGRQMQRLKREIVKLQMRRLSERD